MKIEEAKKYIRSIRNHEKRMYAAAYLDYLVHEKEVEVSYLSFMARQAVRLRLESIMKGEV